MRLALLVGACVLSGCALERGGLDDRLSNGGEDAAVTIDSGAPADAGRPAVDAWASDAPFVPVTDGSPPGPGDGQGLAVDAATGAADAGSRGAGDALDFENGAYVQIGTMPIPNDFTLEAWVKPASAPAEAEILAEDRNTQTANQFRFELLAGRLSFIMTDGTGNSFGLFTASGHSLEAAQALPIGVWSHVAVTKSGASFILYVGGIPVSDFTATSAFDYGTSTLPFRIAARVGIDGTSADNPFSGTIDEVRVWNAARSGADIAATLSQTVSPADAALAAYWRFDEGSGLAASDEEAHHPGTLVAGPTWVTSTAF